MRNLGRAALITAMLGSVTVGFASPALAHVTVSATGATQGGFGVLTFSVPTESDTASTTELRVTLPDDQPILIADPEHKPGWTAAVVYKNLSAPQKRDNGNVVTRYVSQVDWKADNPQAAIPPNQFDMFSLDAGRLPHEASLALPAEQFYSDGHTVIFNETIVAGQATPEHPAPVLKLASSTPSQDIAAPAHNSAPAWFAILALVIAVLALLIGLTDLVLLRRRSS
jgi:uncharacterized protein